MDERARWLAAFKAHVGWDLLRSDIVAQLPDMEEDVYIQFLLQWLQEGRPPLTQPTIDKIAVLSGSTMAIAMMRAGLMSKAAAILEMVVRSGRRIQHPILPMAIGLLGEAYASAGQFKRALDSIKEALQNRQALGEEAYGVVLSVYGSIIAAAGGGYADDALGAFRESLALAEQCGDKLQVATAQDSIGTLYSIKEDHREALTWRAMALKTIDEMPSASRQRNVDVETARAKILQGMATDQRLLGNVGAALTLTEERASLTANLPRNAADDAFFLASMGSNYLETGMLEDAELFFNKALKAAEEAGDIHTRWKVLHNIGVIKCNNGDYAGGLKCFEIKLKRDKIINDVPGMCLSLHEIGIAKNELGDKEGAAESHLEELSLLEDLQTELSDGQMEQASLQCRALIELARIRASQKQFEQSLELLSKCKEISKTPGVSSHAFMYLRWGEIHHQWADTVEDGDKVKGHLEEAVKMLKQAVRTYATKQKNLKQYIKARISIFDQHKTAYNELQQCLAKLGRPWEALLYAERSKARTLLFQLSTGKASHAAANLDTEKPYDRVLQELDQFDFDDQYAWGILQKCRAACGDDAVMVEYTYHRNQGLMIWVLAKNEAWFCSSASIQEASKKAAWSAEVVELEPSIAGQNIDFMSALLQQFRAAIFQYQEGETSAEDVVEKTLSVLNSLLIEPISGVLNSLKPEQKVVFIPHEILAFVPFAALLDEEKTHLITRHTISVAPSMRSLLAMADKPSASSLVEGKEHRSSIQSEDSRSVLVIGNPKPMPLELDQSQFMEKEARSVGEIFNAERKLAEVYIGEETRRRDLKAKLAQAQLVHLATHGVVGHQYSEGAVALAGCTCTGKWEKPNAVYPVFEIDSLDFEPSGPPIWPPLSNSVGEIENLLKDAEGFPLSAEIPEEGPVQHLSAEGFNHMDRVGLGIYGNVEEDEKLGMLSAQEISQWRMKAHLVVLSACHTGHGQLKGEGIMGLSRALQVAQVPAAALALWQASDETSTKFMERFYRQLREGRDVSVAMREVMCGLIEEVDADFEQPVYSPIMWAPFQIYGLPTVCLPPSLQQTG